MRTAAERAERMRASRGAYKATNEFHVYRHPATVIDPHERENVCILDAAGNVLLQRIHPPDAKRAAASRADLRIGEDVAKKLYEAYVPLCTTELERYEAQVIHTGAWHDRFCKGFCYTHEHTKVPAEANRFIEWGTAYFQAHIASMRPLLHPTYLAALDARKPGYEAIAKSLQLRALHPWATLFALVRGYSAWHNDSVDHTPTFLLNCGATIFYDIFDGQTSRVSVRCGEFVVFDARKWHRSTYQGDSADTHLAHTDRWAVSFSFREKFADLSWVQRAGPHRKASQLPEYAEAVQRRQCSVRSIVPPAWDTLPVHASKFALCKDEPEQELKSGSSVKPSGLDVLAVAALSGPAHPQVQRARKRARAQ